MHTILRNAVRLAVHQAERPYVLRTETERLDAQRIAKEGRKLLLHDASNEDTEVWLWRLDRDHPGDHPNRTQPTTTRKD